MFVKRLNAQMLAAFTLALLFALPTTKSAHAADPESVVSSYIYSQVHRLKLTTEQKPKFMRLLSSTSAKRRKIFRTLNIKIGKPSGYANLIKLRSRILGIAPGARKRAAAILTSKQLSIYDAIRAQVGRLLKSKLKA